MSGISVNTKGVFMAAGIVLGVLLMLSGHAGAGEKVDSAVYVEIKARDNMNREELTALAHKSRSVPKRDKSEYEGRIGELTAEADKELGSMCAERNVDIADYRNFDENVMWGVLDDDEAAIEIDLKVARRQVQLKKGKKRNPTKTQNEGAALPR